MVNVEIVQPLNEKQSIDAVDVLTTKGKTERHRFLKALEKEAKSHHSDGKPFCYRCAKIDYEFLQEQEFQKGGMRSKYKVESNVPVRLDTKQYAKKDRFLELNNREVHDTKVFNGMKITYVTKYVVFQCKERGCRLSLETRNEERREEVGLKK